MCIIFYREQLLFNSHSDIGPLLLKNGLTCRVPINMKRFFLNFLLRFTVACMSTSHAISLVLGFVLPFKALGT